MTFKEELESMGACKEAIDWVGDKTLNEAWATCQRGDWMDWYLLESDADDDLFFKARRKIKRTVEFPSPLLSSSYSDSKEFNSIAKEARANSADIYREFFKF